MHEILARAFSENDGESAECGMLFPIQVLEKFVEDCACAYSPITYCAEAKGEWQNHQQERRNLVSDVTGSYSTFVLNKCECQMSTSRIDVTSRHVLVTIVAVETQ